MSTSQKRNIFLQFQTEEQCGSTKLQFPFIIIFVKELSLSTNEKFWNAFLLYNCLLNEREQFLTCFFFLRWIAQNYLAIWTFKRNALLYYNLNISFFRNFFWNCTTICRFHPILRSQTSAPVRIPIGAALCVEVYFNSQF